MTGLDVKSAGIALVLLFALGIGPTARSATNSNGFATAPTITVKKISGTVYLRAPDSTTFAALSGRQRVPVGTEVEASNGKISITASSGQRGDFYQGRFVILVPSGQPNVIELDLSGSSFKNCSKATRRLAAHAPPRRRLWGHAKGRFVTHGRYSITSVRGTTWLTTDGCDGTNARVTQGTIGVTDLLQNRNVVVRKGKTYFSKAPTEYAVPTESSEPSSIVSGPDGNLWFTETAAGKIGRSTPHGDIIEFVVPASDQTDLETGSPEFIIAGPDRNLWFSDPASHSIDRITTAGKITTFAVSGAPHGLTVGSDGNLWFTEDNAKLGRITPTGEITEIQLSLESPSDNSRITTGGGGNLWFVEPDANKIGRVTTSGDLTEFDIPTEDSTPTGITRGSDGNVWFTELTGGKVARITPAGAITEFPLPGGDEAGPDQIAPGPDNNLWVTDGAGSRIVRVSPSGRIVEVPTPSDQSSPSGITAGPGRTIWFTESEGNNIACARC
jgi:streptogramin lyase